MEMIRVGAVVRHQQPARQPGLDFMEARAPDRSRLLRQEYEQVVIDCAAQRMTTTQYEAELPGGHPQCRTSALHDPPQAGTIDPQRQCRAEHAFISNQPNFERWM